MRIDCQKNKTAVQEQSRNVAWELDTTNWNNSVHRCKKCKPEHMNKTIFTAQIFERMTFGRLNYLELLTWTKLHTNTMKDQDMFSFQGAKIYKSKIWVLHCNTCFSLKLLRMQEPSRHYLMSRSWPQRIPRCFLSSQQQLHPSKLPDK